MGGIKTNSQGTGGSATAKYDKRFTATAGQTVFTMDYPITAVVQLFIDTTLNTTIVPVIATPNVTIPAQPEGIQVVFFYR
jgi:hypothetical protein